MHYRTLLSDPSQRWLTIASVFFSTLCNLEEPCLARQVDFKGQVFCCNYRWHVHPGRDRHALEWR